MRGYQIEIAQSPSDEARMNQWLDERASLLALPAISSATVPPPPKPLHCSDWKDNVVFFQSDLERVLAGRSTTTLGEVVLSGPDNDGLLFTWERLLMEEPEIYVPGGGEGSRLYFRRSEPTTPASERMQKLLRPLFAWIRTTHPWLCDGSGSIYVGPGLGTDVLEKKAQLVWPNGSPVRLIPNPKYKDK